MRHFEDGLRGRAAVADDAATGIPERFRRRLDGRHHAAIGEGLDPLVTEEATLLIGICVKRNC